MYAFLDIILLHHAVAKQLKYNTFYMVPTYKVIH